MPVDRKKLLTVRQEIAEGQRLIYKMTEEFNKEHFGTSLTDLDSALTQLQKARALIQDIQDGIQQRLKGVKPSADYVKPDREKPAVLQTKSGLKVKLTKTWHHQVPPRSK